MMRSLFRVFAVGAICLTSAEVTVAQELNDPLLDPMNGDLQTVLTPTRLRQPLSDVPSSVTVITADMISRFGVRSIPEALRLVPGMEVTQVGGSDYRVNYHGTNILTPRRMNVLVDGMSVYRPGFARVDWLALPVSIENIERIEVTRGPNSASYGANSLLAIVNVISKHPSAESGVTGAVSGGSRGTEGASMALSGSARSTAYRVNASHSGDDGYDVSNPMPRTPAHDSTRIKRVSLNTATEFQDGSTFDVQVSVQDQHREVEYVDAGQITFPDLDSRDVYLNARWTKNLSSEHALQITTNVARHTNTQPWTTCVPSPYLLPQMAALYTANKALVGSALSGKVPAGISPAQRDLLSQATSAVKALGARAKVLTCVDTDQNLMERRLEVELQDTLSIGKDTRVVSGIGFRENTAESQTYLGGRFHDSMMYLFANVEYKPISSVSLNAGGFYENTSMSGSAWAPRLALNYHASPNSTFRVVSSKSFRMPDIQEQDANWSYGTSNPRPAWPQMPTAVFFQTAQSPGGLSEERMFSREIGYLGNFPEQGIVFDAKLFSDELSNTISEKLQVSDYRPTNSNSVRLSGAEFQVSYNPSAKWMVHAGYSRLYNSASSPLERTQYSKDSGSIAVSRMFDGDLNLALALYRSTGLASPQQSSFGRQDFTVSKLFRFSKDFTVMPTVTLQHFDNRVLVYPYDATLNRQVALNNAFQLYFSLKFTY